MLPLKNGGAEMKATIFVIIIAMASLVVARPLLACGAEHGYTKTAKKLEQSNIPMEQIAKLKQTIAKSEADHDKYTKNGDYVKMNEAVRELANVNEMISR